MGTKRNVIVADTSALVSLINPTDTNHNDALALARQLRSINQPLLLPGEVLSETLNILGKKFGHQTAVQAGRRFFSGDGEFLPIETPVAVNRVALEILSRVSESVSFTDCVVMAMADHYQTTQVFGFDEAFGKKRV